MRLTELVDGHAVGVGWPTSSKRGAALLFSAKSALDPGGASVNQCCEDRKAAQPPRATTRAAAPLGQQPIAITIPTVLPSPAAAVQIPPLSVMGIGSWPRPRWLMRAIHEHVEGRMSDEDFESTARDAVR